MLTNIQSYLNSNPSYKKYISEKSDGTFEFKAIDKYATSMFICPTSFVSNNESASFEEPIYILNNYFSYVNKIIVNNRGLIINYSGDSILAVFGENDQEKHAEDACNTAQQILKHLELLHTKNSLLTIRSIGIGIDTGPTIFSFIGSNDNFQFSALGPSVNTASRLNSLIHSYKKNVIISRETKNLLPGSFRTNIIDTITQKGKNEPFEIIELVMNPKTAST